MDLGEALAGGFLGTLVLTVALELAAQGGLTRLDLPLLVGALVSDDPPRARAFGHVGQLLVGMGLGVGYGVALDALDAAGAGGGALLGLANGALFVVAVPLLLPLLHPRMALRSGAARRSTLEPPGLLLRHYGSWTPAVAIAAHAAYGAVAGAMLAG